MSEHAKLSPSASKRWLNCTGSVRLSEGVQQTSSAAADEGTTAHFIAEEVLKNGYDLPDKRDMESYTEAVRSGLGADFTMYVNAEMIEHVRKYVHFVREALLQDVSPDNVERRLHISDDLWGTGDYVALDRKSVV